MIRLTFCIARAILQMKAISTIHYILVIKKLSTYDLYWIKVSFFQVNLFLFQSIYIQSHKRQRSIFFYNVQMLFADSEFSILKSMRETE